MTVGVLSAEDVSSDKVLSANVPEGANSSNQVFSELHSATQDKLTDVALFEAPRNYLKKNVIVFDIDGTICRHTTCRMNVDESMIHDPECPNLELGNNVHYIFKPHLKMLFDYLLSKGARICFFSAGGNQRNFPLIDMLLLTMYGGDDYHALMAQGQFQICSSDILLQVPENENGTALHRKKNLELILRYSETLDDAILIEDRPGFMCEGQDPVILVYESSGDTVYSKVGVNSKMQLFAKNGVYYLLGVFKTYFECDKYANLPLRESIKQIIPCDTTTFQAKHFVPTFATQMDMLYLGLKEVRKSVPEALFYGSWADNDTLCSLSVEERNRPRDRPFHHSEEEVAELLELVTSGVRSASEPTVVAFMNSLNNKETKPDATIRFWKWVEK